MAKITINLKGADANLARFIIRDALGEYANNRSPVPAYIKRRYADHDANFVQRKYASVDAKVGMVRDALDGPDTITVEE